MSEKLGVFSFLGDVKKSVWISLGQITWTSVMSCYMQNLERLQKHVQWFLDECKRSGKHSKNIYTSLIILIVTFSLIWKFI